MSLDAQVFVGVSLGAQDVLLCSPPYLGLAWLLGSELMSSAGHSGLKNTQWFPPTL